MNVLYLCQRIHYTIIIYSKVLKLKNSNLSSINFWSSFLMSQKYPTMSPNQDATASSTSSLIWGLKEFNKVVESPTLPWSSLSCFENTPRCIQVSIMSVYVHDTGCQHNMSTVILKNTSPIRSKLSFNEFLTHFLWEKCY